jgi:hypothetical protein
VLTISSILFFLSGVTALLYQRAERQGLPLRGQSDGRRSQSRRRRRGRAASRRPNNAYRIVQAPGYVAIHYEMIHDVRIIPLDGRPHLPKAITTWNGDSRGRWEGNTLVVDITNYTGRGWISTSAAGGRIKGIHQTTHARIEERFTRTAADVIT